MDMERNFNDTFGGSSDTPNVGGSSAQSGSAGAGSTGFGSGAQRADTSFSGAPASMGASASTETTPGGKFGKTRDKIGERAGELKSSLADKLEQGAEKLRQRAHGGAQYAGATAEGSVSVAEDDKIAKVADKVAGGMQSTANWVRNADMESVKGDIQRQVKEHPARSLIVAVGLGYLLGKAFRR
jgi:hypothetical protein